MLGARLCKEKLRLSTSYVVAPTGGGSPFSKENVRLSASCLVGGGEGIPFSKENVKLSASCWVGGSGLTPFSKENVGPSTSVGVCLT